MENEYGCLMVGFQIPWWNTLISNINKRQVYDAPGYGLEYEPHITILYGFHDNVTYEMIKSYIDRINTPVKVTLTNVDSFQTENFDVLKFSVQSDILHKLNSIFKKLPHTTSFPEYVPHMTISYLLPKCALRYETQLKKPITLTSDTYMYSDKNIKRVWKIRGK